MTASPRIALSLGLASALALAPTAALAESKKGGNTPDHASGSSTGHNPPGNNGTIKIGSVPLDGGHGNQPHVGCSFALRFFNFDEAQTADITFTGQAPTKTGTLLSQHAVPISDDAAGGGKDTDAVLYYTVDQLGLRDVPQAKQGWHVKVSVDALEAPGGAKHKVFWLSCPSAGGSTAGSGSTSGTSSTAGSGTTSDTGSTAATGSTAGSGSTLGSGSTVVSKSTPSTFTGGAGTLTPPSSAQGSTYGSGALSSTATPRARGGLPFTGFETGTLVLAALAALGLGSAAAYAGRRQRV